MEKETDKILKIMKKYDGFSCGACDNCLKITRKVDLIIRKLKSNIGGKDGNKN